MSYEGYQLMQRRLSEAVEYISPFSNSPKIGIICGSGLGELANLVEDAREVNYSNIPNFPRSTVAGHEGKFVFGYLRGKQVVCMKGRVHLYEGYDAQTVALPVRVMAALGIQILIVTNASGAINSDYHVGDIMIIKDFLSLASMTGHSPLMGLCNESNGQFLPLVDVFDRSLRQTTRDAAKDLNIDFIREGVYALQVGPTYETVAESRMLRLLGADAVGMSTTPEVTVARQCGLKCLGLALITNKCVTEYDTGRSVNHNEVLEISARRSEDMIQLVSKIVDMVQLE